MRTSKTNREGEQDSPYPFGNQSFISKKKGKKLATPKQLTYKSRSRYCMWTTSAQSAATLE